MKKLSYQFLLVLLLVTLLPLTSFSYFTINSPIMMTSALPALNPLPMTASSFSDPNPPGSHRFVEDFSNTTYRDGPTDAEGWGTGSVTAPRDYSVTLLDSYSTPNPVYDVDIQGRKAYFSCPDPGYTTNRFYVLDISDPSNIGLFGYRTLSTIYWAGKVHGDIYYLGLGVGGVTKINLYNVTNPYRVGGMLAYIGDITPTDGTITDIEVQGHHLYAAIYGSTSVRSFLVADVEDPNSPIRIANDWIASTTLGLDIQGQLAYLAHGIHGLRIVNVSNPYDIDGSSQVGQFNTFGNATDVIVDGAIAYVADGFDGVQIIDVSNPVSPAPLSSYATPGTAQNLALQGKTLFVADGTGGLQVVDVSDPRRPRNVTAITTLPYTYDVDLYGGDVVVGAADGLYIYRIGDGIDDLPLYGVYSGYKAFDVRVQGDIAYVAAGPDGLISLNVSDPLNPVFLDQHKQGTNPWYRKLDIQGNRVYIANYYYDTTWRAILIYDISDPTNLQYLGGRNYTWATDVAIHGEVAFVAVQDQGFKIVNVSNYAAVPQIWGSPTNLGNVTAFWVQGHKLTVVIDEGGALDTGYYIFDITDISSPVEVTAVSSIWTNHYDVFVDGDFSYNANGDSMRLYNVTNPFNTLMTDYTLDYSHPSMGVWGFGPYIVSARGSGGVHLIDSIDVSDISILHTYAGATNARQVTVHGDYAYVANHNSLMILRIHRSAGTNYYDLAYAQSKSLPTTGGSITRATLKPTYIYPSGTIINYFMTNNITAGWELVTPGVEHVFSSTGSDIRWRATLVSNYDDRTPRLTQVTIDYYTNEPPSAPELTDTGTTDPDGDFTVSWGASTDSDGSIDYYELQMSDSNAFTTILDSWTLSSTSQAVSGLTDGTYYFRVRAVDNHGDPGPWSSVESIAVEIPTPPLPPDNTLLLILAIAAVIIIVIIILIIILFRRRGGKSV